MTQGARPTSGILEGSGSRVDRHCHQPVVMQVRSTRYGVTRRAMPGEGDWHRAQAPATRFERLSPGGPRRAKGRIRRASGGAVSRKPDATLAGRAGGREVDGDAKSCGVLADLIDCRSAERRLAGFLARSPSTLDSAYALTGLPGRSSTAGSGFRRGSREQGVTFAWKRGSTSLFASCGWTHLIPACHLTGGIAGWWGAFGKAHPTTEPRRGPPRREAPRVTRDRQVQQASLCESERGGLPPTNVSPGTDVGEGRKAGTGGMAALSGLDMFETRTSARPTRIMIILHGVA